MLLLTISVLMLTAQETTPTGFEQWTSASLAKVNESMSEDAASDPHHFAVRQLADFPNDGFLEVRRQTDGPVEWHETQADVFFVQSGSATLLVGGTLVNGETVSPP